MSTDGPIEVYIARDEMDAGTALAMLRAEGIEGRVVGANLQTASGELGMSYNALPRIWVRSDDATRARELIANHERERREASERPPAEPWRCPACSEEVQGDFDLCWNCETERP